MKQTATKDQERAALYKIATIIDELGTDSYCATAFAGCILDARRNIEEDAAYSMQDRLQAAEREVARLQEIADQMTQERDDAREDVAHLERKAFSISDIETFSSMTINARRACGERLGEAASRIVTFASEANGEDFQKAVSVHRKESRLLDFYNALYERIANAAGV